MFNPIGNVAVSGPLTLVATALPNAIALRAPADNVPPSVSSPELSNNARGNRATGSKTQTPQNISLPLISEEPQIATNDNVARYTSNAQTAFLAQLAGGELSPEVSGIFLQYEKLLSYANVKYKPSNAGKPVDSVGIFKTLLQIESESPKENVLENVSPADAEANIATETLAPQETVLDTQSAQLPQSQISKYQETTVRSDNKEPTKSAVA
jgi:hypothetical protein